MSLILTGSILIRLVALAWSLVLLGRTRDWRLLLLALMLGLMATREMLIALTAARVAGGWSWSIGGDPAELIGLLVGIAALLAVLVVSRSIAAHERERDRLGQVERRFDLLASSIDAALWLTSPDETELYYISPAYERLTGRPCDEVLADPARWLDAVHPDDRARIEAGLASGPGIDPGDRDREVRVVRADGGQAWAWMRSRAVRDAEGRVIARAGVAADITSRKNAEELLKVQREVLHEIVAGRSLPDTLDLLCRAIQRLVPGCLCVASRLDERGPCLRVASAPDFDAERRELLDGLGVGDEGASCGAAAHRGEPVIVEDVSTSGHWKAHLGVAERLGVQACWSMPLLSGRQAVLGTLALTFADPTAPSAFQREVLDVSARLASIAIEQAQIEADLQQSEARYRLIVENARVIAWEFDRVAMRFSFVSRQGETILGYPRAKWREPRFWFHCLHPDDREWAARFTRERSNRGEDHDLEYRMIAANGETVWVRDLTTVQVEGGRTVSLRGLFIDITERRKVEEALRRSEHQFRVVFDEAGIGMATATDDGQLIRCNDTMATMLGYLPEELAGRKIAEITHEDDLEATRAALAALKSGHEDRMQLEKRYLRRDGSECWARLTVTRAADGESQFFIGSIEDINVQRAAELELRRRSETERLLRRELGHRVRNNLASLETLVDLTARSADDLDEFATSIKHRVQAMRQVHELLSSAGWTPIDMQRMIEVLTPPGCSGRMHLEGPTVLIPAARSTALGIVVHELMTNSLKHGALGAVGGVVEVAWTVEDAAIDQCVIAWRERGGPPCGDPTAGVGTSLITGLVQRDLRGSLALSYGAEGASHRISIALSGSGTKPVPTGR